MGFVCFFFVLFCLFFYILICNFYFLFRVLIMSKFSFGGAKGEGQIERD